MLTPEEKQFWTEFIELYKSKPVLWRTNHEDYKHRDTRKEAYEALIEKCKEIDPLADKNFVAKKINCFRSVYKRELKRCNQHLNSGNEYIPSLWYFHHLDFLRDQEESAECETVDWESVYENHEVKNQKENESQPKRFKPNVSSNELVRLAPHSSESAQDPCYQLSTVWANKLSKMNRNQRLFAEKVITEVVFNGELGLLKYNTSLSNINSVENINASFSTLNKTTIDTSDSS